MKLEVLIKKLTELIEPIVEGLGYELYHIEYVKEDGEQYLRIYIDKEDNENGISLLDCENVSRPVSDMLDVEDPITEGYFLEVSSPGLNRFLHKDKHLSKVIGSEVLVKLLKAMLDKKTFKGNLVAFDDKEIIIKNNDEEYKIPRDIIKTINLEGEL
jgi:ribosome maturation factor RimP